MGKVIELDKSLQLKVAGIAKDVPSNSHLHFDLVVPLINYKDLSFMNVWISAAYYAMNDWMQNFAYKTPVSWWIFVLAALITVGIALLTVSIKAVKAAVTNPEKSLRTE